MPALARALLIASTFLLGLGCVRPLPPVIRDEMAATPRGQATVVFFTDFQCPFCRRTHAALDAVLEERGGRVRVVLRHVPLQRHPDARTAARASVCVEKIAPEAAELYANALFSARDLSEASCAAIATAHGVDADRLERCVADPETDRRIDRDVAMFDSIGGDGVPVLYVGSLRLEGMQSRGSLESAIDQALQDAVGR